MLHGDLHHFNILRSDAHGWLAIDAKGVVGEPAYETGALLRNPMPAVLDLPDPARVLRRRADALCEALDLDVARVYGWAYAQAVLSAALVGRGRGGPVVRARDRRAVGAAHARTVTGMRCSALLA